VDGIHLFFDVSKVRSWMEEEIDEFLAQLDI
jgi:hypothetical protein